MAFYQFEKEQKINASIDELWDFISSPKNLKEITPAYMGFDIISKNNSEKMYPGMIISYVVRPLMNLKTNWVTEITQVKDKEYFVDEQRVGPYKIWHHQHILIPVKDGVLMRDIISYQPPFGILGKIANKLVIKKKLNEIFDYRFIALQNKFG
ncbi:MAG: ligand-binding SRPBCC domain-containing protein [Flavobacteriaceae bacterium]|jgi:ligand-binding SRPBCC domain-containing protein|uniref:SRPBCC family protein n=1 Tax=Candidatus Marifrigoribacter sp. Uisw_064 TaxID=3230970 RepID=UPI003AE66300